MDFSTTLIKEFEEFCRTNRLVLPNEKLLVTVSGGVDSMVLLQLLLELRSEWNLDLAVVHVNHQLRGDESTGDEEFVRQTAAHANVAFYCKRVDTIGLKHSLGVSKQVAAREARYQFFEEIRQQTGSNHVATGHQADDDAETVLFNALRGGGVRGLAGIPVTRVSGHIIRPLLFARRKQILSYARERDIQFRNDSSNESLMYTRNYLRHSVVPFLAREFGTDVTNSLNRVSNAMKELSRFLDRLIDDRLPRVVKFEEKECDILLRSFSAEPLFLREEIILRVLRHLGIEPSINKICEIISLCSKQSGHSLNLSGSIVVYRDRDHLIFCERFEPMIFSTNVSIGNIYSFERFTFSLSQPGLPPSAYARDGRTEYIDCDKVIQPLTLRNWRPGDWFVPLGMSGRKKLSDFFNDVKLPPPEKINATVFESDANIVWVCGKRLDNRYRITEATRNAIKLTFLPTTNSTN
jgi:tRNA(Ile)-lysidine synthase